jgi:hypothetical protein
MGAGKGRQGRPGRPWAILKGDDPAIHSFVNELRGLVDASGVSLQDIANACECSRTTVSKRLDGQSLPDLIFVESLVRTCTPRVEQVGARVGAFASRWKKAEQNIGRSRPTGRPEPDGRQLHTHLVEAQAQTIRAQRQLIALHDELADAQRQLVESARADTQACQTVRTLHVVIHLLTRRVEELIRERDLHSTDLAVEEAVNNDGTSVRLSTTRQERERAEKQLQQAQEVRRRATALADAAAFRISELEYERRTGGDTASLTAVATDIHPNQPMVQSTGGADISVGATDVLDRMQFLLDDQADELDRIQCAADALDSGRNCVVCGNNFRETGSVWVPVGTQRTAPAFACIVRCADKLPCPVCGVTVRSRDSEADPAFNTSWQGIQMAASAAGVNVDMIPPEFCGDEFAGAVSIGFDDAGELRGLVGLAEDLDEELRVDVLAFGVASYVGELARIANTSRGGLGIGRHRLPAARAGAGHLAWHMLRTCGRDNPSATFDLVDLDTETDLD